MRATDPATAQAVRAALAARTGTAGKVGEAFAVANPATRETSGAAGSKAPTPESFKKFEAMVLTTFIQNMLPKDSTSFYGKGLAGDMWKSLLAEKVAGSIAERGGIGISDRVLGAHYAKADKPEAAMMLPSPTSQGVAEHPASLSPVLIEDMMRRLNDSLIRDLSDASQTAKEQG